MPIRFVRETFAASLLAWVFGCHEQVVYMHCILLSAMVSLDFNVTMNFLGVLLGIAKYFSFTYTYFMHTSDQNAKRVGLTRDSSKLTSAPKVEIPL